jgi:hypothetical protein
MFSEGLVYLVFGTIALAAWVQSVGQVGWTQVTAVNRQSTL